MYKATKTDDGLWVVEDELGSVVEVCDTRAQARSKIKELNGKNEPAPSVREQLGDAVVDSIERMKPLTLTGVVIDEVADHVPEVDISESKEPGNMADVLAALKQFEQLAQPVEPSKSTVQVVKVEKRVTKSSQVRARIAVAKQNAELPDVVVNWAIENLGMAKGLARVYVKGNWDRVPN